jgi:hypothetical protein
MRWRVGVGVVGVAVFAGLVAIPLAAPVYGDRGRDETFYLTIHPLPVGSGASITQPVPLQRPDASAIEVPYRWLGIEPARVKETLMTTGGSTIFERTEPFPNSRGPRLLQPTSNGSVWQNLTATLKTIAVPAGLPATVVLILTRVDSYPATLFLFASYTVTPPTSADVGSQPDKRPTIIERQGEVLDLETEYGALQPAVVKVPKYVSRIASIAPPWIPTSIFILLFTVAVLIALFLFALAALTPSLPHPIDQSGRQPTEAPRPRRTAR